MFQKVWIHLISCLYVHCVRVFWPLFDSVSRSDCDTAATNYRSGRLKPEEEWVNQNLPRNSLSPPFLCTISFISLFVNLPLDHLTHLFGCVPISILQ